MLRITSGQRGLGASGTGVFTSVIGGVKPTISKATWIIGGAVVVAGGLIFAFWPRVKKAA